MGLSEMAETASGLVTSILDAVVSFVFSFPTLICYCKLADDSNRFLSSRHVVPFLNDFLHCLVVAESHLTAMWVKRAGS